MSYTAIVLNEDMTDYDMLNLPYGATRDREYLVLRANDLCSKFGFGDGSLINDWRRDNSKEFLRLTADDELKTLEALVRTYLKPALVMFGFEVTVGIFENSIHNMVRAIEIDGVEWEDYYAHSTPFDGIEIAIPTAKVNRLIANL